MGERVGACVGARLGAGVGFCVGTGEGAVVGARVGAGVGALVGLAVGLRVGLGVGARVCRTWTQLEYEGWSAPRHSKNTPTLSQPLSYTPVQAVASWAQRRCASVKFVNRSEA